MASLDGMEQGAAIVAETEEQALARRDDRVRTALGEVLSRNMSEIRDLRAQIEVLERENAEIRRNAAQEKWFNLDGYLDPADVESLCAISPVGLLSEEG